MSVKEFVLKKLEENRGIPLSGEAIANSLSVSRAAVWKAVRALEAEGYHIEAVPNQGYTLCTDNDLLSTQGILPYLTPPLKSREIRVFPCLPSTNQEAKRMALERRSRALLCLQKNKAPEGADWAEAFFLRAAMGFI